MLWKKAVAIQKHSIFLQPTTNIFVCTLHPCYKTTQKYLQKDFDCNSFCSSTSVIWWKESITYLMIAIAYIIRSISPGSIAAVSGNPVLFFTKPFQRIIIHNSSRGKESIQFGEEQKNRRNGGEKVGRET